MRIVIDLQACQSTGSRNRGIGRYSLALAQAMARQATYQEIYLLLSKRFPETIAPIQKAFQDILPPEQIITFDVPASIAEAEPSNHWRLHAAERIRENAIANLKPDIVHVSSLFEGFGDDTVTSVGLLETHLKTAVTLYDLIPLIHAQLYLENDQIRQWYHRKIDSLKEAELLLAISSYSRQEAISVLERSEDSVINLSAAADEHFQRVDYTQDQARKLCDKYGLERPFIVYTGGIDTRKNIEGMIEAYAGLPASIRASHQLAIICSVRPEDKERLLRLSRFQGLSEGEVVFTGYVPNEDLILLYNLCELFVFPSLYEGFGLPALEAMACGAPVIGSNTSSIPEVIGRQDALFNPTKIDEITASMYRALTDDQFQSSLRQHGPKQAASFSWDQSALRALEAFESLHAKYISQHSTQVQVPNRRPHLAFVSPLPPEKSGIANYSFELLPELAHFYEITLVINQVEVKDDWLTNKFSIRDVAWFENHAQQFDRIIYQIGNSSFHEHMFALVEQHPGIVVLHDFYLSHILHHVSSINSGLPSFYSKLYESHGYSALLKTRREGIESAVWNYPCNKTVLDHAIGVIVHSQFAEDSARKAYGAFYTQSWKIVRQIYSSPSKIERKSARSKLNLSNNDWLICSFGHVGPIKLNHRLVDAWLSSSLALDHRCFLVFVGENQNDGYGRSLIDKIKKSGLEDRIYVTGFIESEQYRDYLMAADAAVQLRHFSRGETSRAVLEAMAYGLPLIVNDVETIAEYPDDIFVRLPKHFSEQALVAALEKIYRDSDLRDQLRESGQRYILENHAPRDIGKQYYQAVEEIYENSPYVRYERLLKSLRKIKTSITPGKEDSIAVASAIAYNHIWKGQKQLFVDISSVISNQVQTLQVLDLIQSMLFHVVEFSSSEYRIEPVFFDGKNYRYARSFMLQIIGVDAPNLNDDIIDVSHGDLFL